MKTNRREFIALGLGLIVLPKAKPQKQVGIAELNNLLREHYTDFRQSDDEGRKFILGGWKELSEKFFQEGRMGAHNFSNKIISYLEGLNGGKING